MEQFGLIPVQVDMVLLGGDLFHDNKPSRKSMYQVMRSLRMNCLGEKPCEIEILSDPSVNFQGYVPCLRLILKVGVEGKLTRWIF